MGMSVASMGMYDLPTLRGATDALWRGLARALKDQDIGPIPRRLNRNMPYHATWRHGGLLFSQTCGYPLTHDFARHLTYVATPIYAVPGCIGPYYSSAILVREDDPGEILEEFRGRRLALNGWDSQSGMNCLRPLCAPLSRNGRFFNEIRVSGGHLKSIRMVRDGQADLCAADAVTVALAKQETPESLDGLRCLCWSPPAPALPYVTAAGTDDETVARLRTALCHWIADPLLATARRRVRLLGIDFLPPEAYESIPAMRIAAERQGYFELHAPTDRPDNLGN